MGKPLLLDLFCCAGGAAMGYHRAGFDVVGVDIKPQPRYPFTFVQGDALEYLAEHGAEFDAIHASPPCQAYSEATPMEYRKNHPDLIAPTRKLLIESGKPFVIENVENARSLLLNPVLLCGSMFGLNIFRHRYFETSPFWLMAPFSCRHDFNPVLPTGQSRKRINGERIKANSFKEKQDSMGMWWANEQEITEAIPPAYTEFIGRHLLSVLPANTELKRDLLSAP